MNIIHRLSFNDKKIDSLFGEICIKPKGGIVHYFDIGENDKKWPIVKKILMQNKTSIIDNQYKTSFTKKELSQSKNFVMEPMCHLLYPEPQIDFGYEKTTYDSTQACSFCGQGMKRQDLFSIKKEPAWGNKDIIQLNWVFDEFFVTEKLKELLMREFKVNFLPVKIFGKDAYCKNMFNLEIKSIVTIEDVSYLNFEKCPVCGKIKYAMCHNNYFPKISKMDSFIAWTAEYFGSGHSAFRQVIINRNLYDFFIQNNIKGVNFIPVAL
ncbi:MAG: hypothetical protein IK002_01220 [Treponema sp.]|uniref:hypothetical protein n=1 Tax=Treponema sp. TaxID=166 RepID=UPI00298E3DA4|nr:hypothetical protein [Treponema sp.]MBR5932585.1 hypothetical protein [Treponema sp.]